MDINTLLEESNYMPKRFRDFHDQKDLFKYIHHKVNLPNDCSAISWVAAHIYIVDIFLYFMAKRGYTLQKSRHKIDFTDIDKELVDFRREKNSEFSSIINSLCK